MNLETIKNCSRHDGFSVKIMNDVDASFDQDHETNDLWGELSKTKIIPSDITLIEYAEIDTNRCRERRN